MWKYRRVGLQLRLFVLSAEVITSFQVLKFSPLESKMNFLIQKLIDSGIMRLYKSEATHITRLQTTKMKSDLPSNWEDLGPKGITFQQIEMLMFIFAYGLAFAAFTLLAELICSRIYRSKAKASKKQFT